MSRNKAKNRARDRRAFRHSITKRIDIDVPTMSMGYAHHVRYGEGLKAHRLVMKENDE